MLGVFPRMDTGLLAPFITIAAILLCQFIVTCGIFIRISQRLSAVNGTLSQPMAI